MLGVGDVGDPAMDDGCNGEPRGVTVCSEDPSVDEVEVEDVPEDVGEGEEDADEDPDVNDMTDDDAPGHTSTDFPGMANRTCRVGGACASVS